MKTHNFKLTLLPNDGRLLLGIQYEEILLEDDDTGTQVEGHMIQIGLFFIKLTYVYAIGLR